MSWWWLSCRILRFSFALQGTPWGSSSSFSMTLPDNPSPLASNNLESSSTTYPHPGTAYSKPALPRRVSEFTAMNGVTFRWYPCRLLQSSILQNTLQPRPALTRTSSQSNARHDPKNGQARKQIHDPLLHKVFGRCPSRNFIRWQTEESSKEGFWSNA